MRERVAGMREIRVLSQLLTVEKPLVLGLEGGVRVVLDGAHELTHCENLLVCPHAKRVRLVHAVDEQRHVVGRFELEPVKCLGATLGAPPPAARRGV